MKCVTPMVRYYLDYTLEEKLEMKRKGEKQFNRILPRSYVLEALDNDENYYTHLEKLNKRNEKTGSRYRFGLTPCKKCWACRLKYSAEWATRIMLECQYHENNYFITLTYNDENLPVNERITYKDKEGNTQVLKNDGTFKPSLSPRDCHVFFNSLRKYFERKGHIGIKYYCAGEYGELNGRPHLHAIIMNCPLDMSQFYDAWEDENHKMHFHSKELDKIWHKGIVDVALVEWSSAAYVARYGTKLFLNNGSEEDYAKMGMVREFVRMSRNPAIGKSYYTNHVLDIYSTDEIIMKTVKGNIGNMKPPKYFDKLFGEMYPEWLEMLKQDRMTAAKRSEQLIKRATNITDKERYERMAQNILTKGNMLKRTHVEQERLQRKVN